MLFLKTHFYHYSKKNPKPINLLRFSVSKRCTLHQSALNHVHDFKVPKVTIKQYKFDDSLLALPSTPPAHVYFRKFSVYPSLTHHAKKSATRPSCKIYNSPSFFFPPCLSPSSDDSHISVDSGAGSFEQFINQKASTEKCPTRLR